MHSYARVNMESTLFFVLSILRLSLPAEIFRWGYHGYSGPEFWPEHVPTCGGRSQSPVDIQSSKYDSSLGDLTFIGYNRAGTDMYKIKNNGHTIQVDVMNNYPKISGGGLDSEYRAVQFHFHWGGSSSRGSEHTLNGKMYPMELHIVHYNTNLQSTDALSNQADALAVLGFFFKVTSSDNENLTPVLSQFANIRHADSSNSVSLDSTFNLQSILPHLDNQQTYHRYSGSLTTPNCYEIVIWTVFENTIGISERQLAMFRDVFETDVDETPALMLYDNFRPVQILGSREITTNVFHWSYEEDLNTGPSHWAQHYEACAGKMQSPIDIPREEEVQYAENLGFIQFYGYNEVRVHKLSNNGHSLQVDVSGNSYISGGGLGARYKAAQFHFHWGRTSDRGSEHTFDGTAFPMELHIVHYKEEYGSVTEALGKSDGLAVLGFMFKVSPFGSYYYGKFLRNISDVKYSGESTNTTYMRLTEMLPIDQQNLQYFRYNGSLTTPPCTESAIWTLFTKAIYISEEQLQNFRELYYIKKPSIPVTYGHINDNYRPVQKLNGRRVLKNFQFPAALRSYLWNENKHQVLF